MLQLLPIGCVGVGSAGVETLGFTHFPPIQLYLAARHSAFVMSVCGVGSSAFWQVLPSQRCPSSSLQSIVWGGAVTLGVGVTITGERRGVEQPTNRNTVVIITLREIIFPLFTPVFIEIPPSQESSFTTLQLLGQLLLEISRSRKSHCFSGFSP
jgi:hypothetical protein